MGSSLHISDLIGDNVKIGKDGAVTGTIKFVKSFKEFDSGNVANQSGNYFPIKLNEKYSGKTIYVTNKSSKEKSSTDLEWILRLSDGTGSTFEFKDDQKSPIIKLSFNGATLNES